MRINTNDLTLKRNYLKKYRYLIKEYEEIKKGKHVKFKRVGDFYKFHDTDRRSFLKYYNRYLQSGFEDDLLPQKRGAKYKSRQASEEVEKEVISYRQRGMNRYEIHNALKPKLGELAPSPSGVYNILRRNNLNKLKPKMKEEKRRIIKEKAGELGHIDCHHLSKAIIRGESRKRYLVCIVDSCTRIAWAEIVDDIKSLTVMFSALRCINVICEKYNIKFQEVLTDNGPEFGTKESSAKREHPFERMLIELGIKHRYIKPYRPQTNGKVERFWRTLEEELLEDTDFDSIEELNTELIDYLHYYNQFRPHSALNGQIPANFNNSCPRIT